MAEKTLGEIACETWVETANAPNYWQRVADAIVQAHEARRWWLVSEALKDGRLYIAFSDGVGLREGTFTIRWSKRGYWVDERGKHWHADVIAGVTPLPAPPKEASDGEND